VSTYSSDVFETRLDLEIIQMFEVVIVVIIKQRHKCSPGSDSASDFAEC
jgi:hypothetical protein